MFKSRKPVSKTPKMNDMPVIASQRVKEVTQSYYSIRLSEGYSREEYDDAYKELDVFRKQWYGDESGPEMEVAIDGSGTQVLCFPTSFASTGTSYNPLVYSNITHARDLMEK